MNGSCQSLVHILIVLFLCIFQEGVNSSIPSNEATACLGVCRGGKRPGGKLRQQQPFDARLYDELQIAPTAASNEITKAYRKLALKFHPDKNPGNLEAEEKFKKVNEAYAILSVEDLRREYDKKGYEFMMDMDGAEGAHQAMDPIEVFRQYFGGGRFDHLVGELPTGPWDWESEKARHELDAGFFRAQALAAHLVQRLDLYTMGQWQVFDQVAWAEVERQLQEEMGPEVLNLVAKIYVDYGHKNLGLYHSRLFSRQGITGRIKELSEKTGFARNLLTAAGSTTHLLLHNTFTRKRIKENHPDRPTEVLLKALWHLSIINIKKTVRQACRMLLKDPNVPPSVLKMRAEALIRLGQIYSEIDKYVPIYPTTRVSMEESSQSASL